VGLWGFEPPDLLHAIENPLGSLACGEPSGVNGSRRHGSGRGLQRSEQLGRLHECGLREPASANGRSHEHPACYSGWARDARCRQVASRPTVKRRSDDLPASPGWDWNDLLSKHSRNLEKGFEPPAFCVNSGHLEAGLVRDQVAASAGTRAAA
jgi:hypothetical protein